MISRISLKGNLIWAVLGPYKKNAVLQFVIMLFAGAFEAIGLGMIVPFIGAIIGSNIVEENGKAISYFNDVFAKIVPDEQRLLGICVIIFTVFLVKNVFIYLNSVLTTHFDNTLKRYWSSSILEKYVLGEYDYVISQKVGTLINSLITEPMLASKFVAQLALYISRAVITVCIYSVMLLIRWRVTLILSLVGILFVFIIWKASTRISIAIGKKRIELYEEMSAEAEQALSGIRQVKLFSIERRICEGFSQKCNELKRILVRLEIIKSMPIPLGETLLVLCLALSLLYFEYFGGSSAASALPLLAFFAVTCQKLYQNAAVLVSGRMWLLSYIPAVRLVNSIVHDSVIKGERMEGGVVPEDLPGDITFEDVSFSYDEKSVVFRDLRVSIPKNRITAIVGKSGSGKSTLVDLLCGLYKGYEGRIVCGSYELSELDLVKWRKMIGFVSQDTFLFNASVKENISVGKPGCTEGEVISAAEQANAHDFIMKLPQGYDTILGDRGLKISGGQRQRITVARALIRSPKLLIFDEATSSLDTQTERLMQESIDSLKGERTIIIISHRLSTITNADLIYVLDKGRIVRSGSYEEVVSNNDEILGGIMNADVISAG